MKKEKRVRARAYADLSLQFYRDKEGTPNFLITSNKTEKPLHTGIDTLIFAKSMAESDQVSASEFVWFCDFFRKVSEELAIKLYPVSVAKFESENTILRNKLNQIYEILVEKLKKA